MQEQAEEPDWWRYTLRLPMVRDPGRKAVYCSASPNLLGAVLRGAIGESIPRLFHRLVAEPLGIRRYHMPLSWSVALFSGVGQPADARRAALHAAGLRPRAGEPQRPDAGRAVGLPGRRLRVPGRARSDPLARRGARGRPARPQPRHHRARRGGAAVAAEPECRRGAAAGARPRPDPRLPHRAPARSRSSICRGSRSSLSSAS